VQKSPQVASFFIIFAVLIGHVTIYLHTSCHFINSSGLLATFQKQRTFQNANIVFSFAFAMY